MTLAHALRSLFLILTTANGKFVKFKQEMNFTLCLCYLNKMSEWIPLLVLQCQIYPRRSGKEEKLRHNELAGQTTLAIIEKATCG